MELNSPEDMETLQNIIRSRSEEAGGISIDMSEVQGMNLATFNALVVLYVRLRRMGKKVKFVNCQTPKMKELISKTQFSHVFQSS